MKTITLVNNKGGVGKNDNERKDNPMKKTARIAFVFMALLMACATGYSKPWKGLFVKDDPLPTTIHGAAVAGRLDIIKALVASGADVNARDKIGWTPLMMAVYYEQLGSVKTLIANGANVNLGNKYGETPLIFAVQKGNLDIVKVLAAHGANVNAKDTLGPTSVLEWAVTYDNMDIVKVLIAYGARK